MKPQAKASCTEASYTDNSEQAAEIFSGHAPKQNLFAELPLQYFSQTTEFMYSCVRTDGLKHNFNSSTLHRSHCSCHLHSQDPSADF